MCTHDNDAARFVVCRRSPRESLLRSHARAGEPRQGLGGEGVFRSGLLYAGGFLRLQLGGVVDFRDVREIRGVSDFGAAAISGGAGMYGGDY